MKMIQAKQCVTCGKSFTKTPSWSQARWAERRFCSNSCSAGRYRIKSTEIGVIFLSNGKRVLVDDSDWELLNSYPWHEANGYARRTEYLGGADYQNTRHYMHRQIVGAPDEFEVDHINGNRLDNRRCNLRLATRHQNGANRRTPPSNNTSGHIGVIWVERTKKWHARIAVNGQSKHLGCFDDITEAIVARKVAEYEYFGEFAHV